MRNLQLAEANFTGGGCACCSTNPAPAATAETVAGVADLTTTIGVHGMTCGHCVGAVTGELSRLEGVHAVDVALVAGGVSTVTVTSRGPLSAGDLAGAVANARYELTDLVG